MTVVDIYRYMDIYTYRYVYKYRRFILEQFGCNLKEIYTHFGYYLQKYSNIKTQKYHLRKRKKG